MRLKINVNFLIIIFEVTMLTLILFFSLRIVHLYNQLSLQEANRFKMLHKANMLRHSSDDLTHFARTYVVTGKIYFKDRFFDVLNIREGRVPEPQGYQNIYWDVVDLKFPPKYDQNATAKSLIEQMKELPYTKKEFSLLAKAQEESNDLVKLEEEAFFAMKGLYKDQKGIFTVQAKSNQDYAIKLLHSHKYYQAKKKIMSPIKEFISLLDNRTHQNIQQTLTYIEINKVVILLLIALFTLGNAFVYLYLDKQKKLLKQKDYELIQKSRLAQMGETISMIAHQWRQPLSAISASSSTLQTKIHLGKYDKEALLDNLNKIDSFVLYLSQTIDDFRNYFKPNKAKTLFNLKQTVENTVRLAKGMLSNSQVQIETSYTIQSNIYNHENQIIQVLLNLIKNAVDALDENKIEEPKIIISINQKKESVILTIEDNAGGIPEEIQDKIFEPYFSTKSKNGTGLGLYMSKQIIEEYCNGSLNVHNTSIGTCFTISLPLQSK